ncbi:hypothetical protein C9I92_09755 [Photobacterium ganghwense]|uniref:Uncharacterized protein n=1 Tax=Photobacterium ganghwense TaxID=320778 RepID=A0A0J1HFC6_9GAMM|nr:hypothetical protein [Photobacterium ganghwense]KLV10325.1 hypothetical protein ABT57_07140 [Photobacterium ganghwense]PSU09783.1 hypothetical protein C9I92_09755 [Photobacterium ganghwense]QSV17030.1 hypothetical protein FH974_18975 [Photobacterium ganghwense]
MKWLTRLNAICCLFFSVSLMSQPLPINQFNALQVLSHFNVSTIELPVYIERNEANLYGQDANHNSLRDDFEQYILEHYQQPEHVAMAILAAQTWKRLLEVTASQQSGSFTRLKLISEIQAIKQCFRQLETHQPEFHSASFAYFNTPQRADARKQAEQHLSSWRQQYRQVKLIEDSQPPCQVFKRLMQQFLPATQETLHLAADSVMEPTPHLTQ